ncbi:MAG: 3-dehydroquinate synthase [Bacteroidia bacterium]|nr:3-dehydroquinate synthase [Bacteroidia bacterium]
MMTNYPIYIGSDALLRLKEFLEQRKYSGVLVLVDANTQVLCYPLLQPFLPAHSTFEIPSGEIHKNLNSCIKIWEHLTHEAFDRKGLVINLGGGVIGDMGGFVAATYKRGIDFIQVPTTLLSQVDASVGGKLGIDFQGYKNHIGVFCEPQAVVIWPEFLDTLTRRELLSGMAEVIKHHLIADREGWNRLKLTREVFALKLEDLIRHSIKIKSDIVQADPLEKGLRKALNFGHTIGHAIESQFLETSHPLLHGEAIAIGMIAESWISHQEGLISQAERDEIAGFIKNFYGKPEIPSSFYPEICDRALNDKKNQKGKILCTLLDGIGKVRFDSEIRKTQIEKSLDFYNLLS